MNKKTLIIIIISMSIGLLLVAGFSVAFFSAKVFGNENANNTVIETETLRIIFTDTEVLSMDGIIPGQSVSKTFTVENRGSKRLIYTISIVDLVNTFVGDELIYSLVSDAGANEVEPVPTEDGIIYSTNIAAGVTQTYTFTLTFKETGSNQNSNMGAIFSGKLQINSDDELRYANGLGIVALYVDNQKVDELEEGKYYTLDEENSYCENGETIEWNKSQRKISIYPLNKDTNCKIFFIESNFLTLTEQIIKDNKNASTGRVPADTESNINFGSVSSASNGQGLYQTGDLTKTENSIPVYYYRGAVTNNYVVFGNYCWRIVRTVEDGSVRLRYGGVAATYGETYSCSQTGVAVNIASSQAYNTSYNNKSYVNYKTSNIRTTVENWYRDNIAPHTSLTELIADTPYCNDISEPTTNYFGAYNRLYLYTNKSPQYKCPSSTYGYTVAKGDLTYPVGLLTADEVAYAGGVYGQSNSSYYLYTNEYYWTMSPSSFSGSVAYVFYVNSDGYLRGFNVSSTSAAVPAVSLKPEATVKRGTGAYNDPYVIMTE